MIDLHYAVEEDMRQLGNFRRRGFGKIVKEGLKRTALAWHTRFLPIHFTRRAYSRYRRYGAYTNRKRFGDPFVESGSLRERMLRPRTTADAQGTSKKVTLRLPIGRPPKYDAETLRKAVFAVMAQDKLSYRQAQRRVYSRAQYDRATRKRMHTDLSVVAAGEAKTLRTGLRKHVVAQLNKHGKKRRRKVRA